jgi:hypothetical protein
LFRLLSISLDIDNSNTDTLSQLWGNPQYFLLVFKLLLPIFIIMGIGSIVIGGFIGGIAVWFIMRKKCNGPNSKMTQQPSSRSISESLFDPFGSVDDSPEGNYPAEYSFRSAIKMY